MQKDFLFVIVMIQWTNTYVEATTADPRVFYFYLFILFLFFIFYLFLFIFIKRLNSYSNLIPDLQSFVGDSFLGVSKVIIWKLKIPLQPSIVPNIVRSVLKSISRIFRT